MGRSRLAASLVVLLTIAAYWPAVRSPLLFDDATSIGHNTTTDSLWPPARALHAPPDSPTAGRPVANYSLALNVAINRAAGVDPTGADSTTAQAGALFRQALASDPANAIARAGLARLSPTNH
jgi:hypothetical protein